MIQMNEEKARQMVYEAIDLANCTHATDEYQEALDFFIDQIREESSRSNATQQRNATGGEG